MHIGVLALQGGFQKHIDCLNRLDVTARPVRVPNDLSGLDGLVFPGGESTTQFKLLKSSELFDAVLKFGQSNPVFGTCAGAILMGSSASDFPHETFSFAPIHVIRNAYGTQVNSFEATYSFQGLDVRSLFIRAPKLRFEHPDVSVLAKYQDEAVVVQCGHYLIATGHPELSNETAVHAYFVDMINENAESQ